MHMKSLANLSSSEIAKAVRLAKKKESILNQIADIESELSAIGNSPQPATKRRGRPAGKAKRKPGPKPGRKAVAKQAPRPKATAGKRGALKTKIISTLKAAGPDGIAVKDIATKLKVKAANVYSWFYTTGGKLPGITKVGSGKYALKS